ncbi:CPBP family intramembrane metalloprotease [bacterium]|nr:CPBP family intramembrane metalloprotease [bacterium]
MITEDMAPPGIEKHSIWQSVGLHLLPGILVGAFYYAIAQPIRNLGYPSMAAMIIATIIILIPFELGFLLYQGKKKNGTLSLKGVVLFRQPIPLWQYLIWVPVIFVSVGLVFTSLTPVSSFLESLFFWMPEALRFDAGLGGEYSKSVLITTYLLAFFFTVLIAPTVEELYFRGYLLPRMPVSKGWTPILHSGLFALYHTWTPWMVITRTIGLLPLVYIVQRKRNIYLGILIHILANAVDIIVGVAFIFILS